MYFRELNFQGTLFAYPDGHKMPDGSAMHCGFSDDVQLLIWRHNKHTPTRAYAHINATDQTIYFDSLIFEGSERDDSGKKELQRLSKYFWSNIDSTQLIAIAQKRSEALWVM